MRRTDLIGVWRLRGITNRGGKVMTGQTHLVAHQNQLWEVWPDSTYYEGEPGPEHEYDLEEGQPGRLQVIVPEGRYCFLVDHDGDTLRMRRGGVFGSFPDSIDDESGGLEVYDRVEGEEAARLSLPPPRMARRTLDHDTLGRLVYDDNLDWWTATVPFGDAMVAIHVAVRDADAQPRFDAAAKIVQTLACDELRKYAASTLLALHNDTWRDEAEDGPPIDADEFAARMTPDALIVEEDDGVTVWFDDGDLFWGHTISVSLHSDLTPYDAGIAG
jgi:hypothetical protein